jgi:2'-5' RNA ligase
MRLFIALDLPETVKDQLETLRDRRIRARWTTRPQWHITLHFLGERDDEAAICDVLAGVHAASFALTLAGVGTFPERGKARVLWAGIEAPSALQTLHQKIGEALQTIGFQPDSRPYHPHMTLARFDDVAPDRELLGAYLDQHRDFRSETGDMTHFTLYESKLERSGAVYSARARFPLVSTLAI